MCEKLARRWKLVRISAPWLCFELVQGPEWPHSAFTLFRTCSTDQAATQDLILPRAVLDDLMVALSAARSLAGNDPSSELLRRIIEREEPKARETTFHSFV